MAANPSFLRPIPGGLAVRAAGPGLWQEFRVFGAEQQRAFHPERWGLGLGARGRQCALFAALAFLGFAHDRRYWPPWQTTWRPERRTLGATLFFRRPDGPWATRLRSRLVAWVWHLRHRLGCPWERCLFLVRYLRPVVLSVAAGYARQGRAAECPCPAAACGRLLSRAVRNLERLAAAEQSWHPKDAGLALTWWDLQAARTLAAGRYLRRYPAGPPPAADRARYEALADLVVLCLLSLTPQPRSSILRRLQFGVTLRREAGGGRWWLDLSNPFELAAVHKTARYYYDREYVQPLPLLALRRCGHDGPRRGSAGGDGSLLGWVLQEWYELGQGLGTRGFVFSCRYPGLGRGRGRGALIISDDELQARLTGALVRAAGVPPERARTLHVWQLRKLAETFLALAGDAEELRSSYFQYFGLHGADPGALAPVHQLTAALHQHCQRTAQRRYLYYLVWRERLRALLDDFDSFWARALVYDEAHDKLQLDPDFVRAWLGGG